MGAIHDRIKQLEKKRLRKNAIFEKMVKKEKQFLYHDTVEYMNGEFCAGYFGHSNRTYATDKIALWEAKKHNVGLAFIGEWMTGTRARHFMDNCETKEEFAKKFRELLKTKELQRDLLDYKQGELDFYKKELFGMDAK